MKKFYLLYLGLLFGVQLNAQDYNWHFNTGSTGSDGSNAVAVDAAGNVYSTGFFSGTVDFDPGPGTANLTSLGGTDTYILKLDANGDYVWAYSIKDANNNRGTAIAIDSNDDIIFGGYFDSGADFALTGGSSYIISQGGRDFFVMKIQPNGATTWLKAIGGSGDDETLGLAIDSDDNVIVTGEFEGTVDFDTGIPSENMTSAGQGDIFTLKMDVNGNFNWVNQIGGTGYDYSGKVAVDDFDNIISTGTYQGALDFDPGAGVTTLTSNGSYEIFARKLDENGDFVWAKSIGGTDFDYGYGVATDGDDNVLLTGRFRATVDFDPGAGTENLTSVGGYDIYVVKLDEDGEYVWAYSQGGTGDDYGYDIKADAANSVYVFGDFNSDTDFDPSAGDLTLSPSGGSRDMFIQKVSENKDLYWAYVIGGANNEFAQSITLNDAKDVFVSGSFQGTVDFDPSVNTENGSASGGVDLFVGRYDQCVTAPSTDVISSCSDYTWIDGVTYTSSNSTATFQLVNDQGCDSIITLDLTIAPLVATATQSGSDLMADLTGASYQWLDCNNAMAVISGETNQQFSPSQNGNYAVEVTSNGCSDTTDCMEVTGLGIYNEQELLISIYPNPADNVINISSNYSVDGVTVYSADGRMIQQVNSYVDQIDCSDLPSGIYFLELNIGAIKTQRLIHKR